MGTALKQLRFYEVEIRELEPRIIEIDYGTQIITAELLEAVVGKVHKEWPDYKVAVLVRAASAVDLGRVAKVVEEEKLAKTTAAVAILGQSKLAQMLGNLFMRYERSPYPNRLFTDKEAALVWLRAQLRQD